MRSNDPVGRLLFCPNCATQHVDVGYWAKHLHRDHACASCGFKWRVEPACVGIKTDLDLGGFDALRELYFRIVVGTSILERMGARGVEIIRRATDDVERTVSANTDACLEKLRTAVAEAEAADARERMH